jgi:hypothetical protein
MRNFRHRRGRIGFEVFAALLIGSAAAAGWVDGHRVRMLVIAVVATLYALYRAAALFARNPALSFDLRGVSVGGLLGISSYSWDKIREIREVKWRRSNLPIRLPSWVPAEQHYVELKVPAGAFTSGSIKLRADMIEMPSGGPKELVGMLLSAQHSALGPREVARVRLGVGQDQQQKSLPVSGVQAERWSRLGLGTEAPEEPTQPPVAQPPAQTFSQPVRPTFGRKIR